MAWAAIGGAAVGVVGNAMMNSGGSQTNGGAGTQTVNRDPWSAAQPWLRSNITQGQNLQTAYKNQPFSALQNQAYQNQNNQSAYMHGLVPNLLGQISSQHVGFDRSNPNARPTAFNFGAADNAGQQSAAAAASQPQGLGLLNMAPATLNLNANTPQVAAPAAAPAASPTFTQETMSDPYIASAVRSIGGTPSTGGYGTFKYGDRPAPGTQAYLDQQLYFQAGGVDPQNLYGRSGFGFGGTNSGDSVGGSPAADGSGGGGPGVF